MAQTQTLRIVVASPGDVQTERDLLPNVIEELNRGIAAERGLHCVLSRWETDTHPGFHPKGPQGLIDPILKIADCDLLIGIFWKRFGTPTPDGKTGTEHEFAIAYETWKAKGSPQIMVYFNQKPYKPKSKAEIDQWGRVLEFQANFPKDGLWWPYKNKTEFEKLVRNHLTNYIRSLPKPDGREGPSAIPANILALHQLPSPPADFTGREAEMAELMTALKSGGATISGLRGQGGVGKTTLALKLAEQLKDRYPDAQFYLDLRGAGSQPVAVTEALAHVIHAYHPGAKLPESEAELRGIFLSVLHNQRALLLMDNARDRRQVEPLIPPAGCALLVTSRQSFTLPGLFARNLDSLSPDDSRKLLLTIAPRIGELAGEIARLCGYLPLALRLAASAIAERPNIRPAEYTKQLASAQKRLELIDIPLSLSYEMVGEELQRRWGMLAVFPESFDEAAAAAVWNVEGAEAQRALGELLAFSLVEWSETDERYRLHDLARVFADSRMSEAERESGEKRHAEYYLEVFDTAKNQYLKGGDEIIRGLALFDLERVNIEKGQSWAAAHAGSDSGAAELCIKYREAGGDILDIRHHPRERIRWSEAMLDAARRLKRRWEEGSALCYLGSAYYDLGETTRAIEFYEQYMKIARETGDRRGEGHVLGNLGIAYANLGETTRAIEFYEQYMKIARETGDRRGEGIALWNAALALDKLGERAQAITYAEAALVIYEQIEDPKAGKVREQIAKWKPGNREGE